MEIEFKNDAGEPTGERLYIHLKSGDSYVSAGGGVAVFNFRDESHAQYWMRQTSPVLLVRRTEWGEVRWMEVREYLRRESDDGAKPVRQIVFDGERFDVMSVRRWRDRLLNEASR